MSSITLQHLVDGALTNATTVRLQDPTATYGVRHASTGVVAVAPTGTITPTQTGVYSYDTSALSADVYEAAWQIQYPAGVYAYRYQTFSVDATAPFTGVRLMDIERELSVRIGDYTPLESGDGSTTGIFQSDDLISSIESGEYTDRYLLRRGRRPDGSAVIPFVDTDRVRQVAEVNLAGGQLVNDRPWTNAPADGEEVELHVLHPVRELRAACLRGLRRCYFRDVVALTFSGTTPTYEADLTETAGWLLRENQVVGLAVVQTAQFPQNTLAYWPFTAGGHLMLRAGFWSPSGYQVTALRPASSYVNGATSLAGPNDDDDVVAVDLEYAVAAAHVEAWRVCPARLLPAAQVGLQPSRQDTAREFTKISLERVPRKPRPVAVYDPPPYPLGNTIQIGA